MNKVGRLKKSRARSLRKSECSCRGNKRTAQIREEIKDQNRRTQSRIKGIKEFIPLRKGTDDLNEKRSVFVERE